MTGRHIFITATLLSSLISVKGQITAYYTENKTPEYREVVDYYQTWTTTSSFITEKSYGPTDAGLPLTAYVIDKDRDFHPDSSRANKKSILLINNAIHPGEPDGVDACINITDQLLRDDGSHIPENVVIVIIPAYNIGGMLNRGSHSRANQNGPEAYGFRGNTKNYDLNRDFIKADSKEAIAFASLFQEWQPDIFIDTHVSNGADYQHVMTLVPTQHDKLAPPLGTYLTEVLLPYLYKEMDNSGFLMSPYVNTLTEIPDQGIIGFMDYPRYSTGYAALFNTIGFMTETHMLKDYSKRVESTIQFINLMMAYMENHATEIISKKAAAHLFVSQATTMPLDYLADLSCYDSVSFMGYEAQYKVSEVTGAQRLFYDRTRPWTRNIPVYDHFDPNKQVRLPKAYIVPKEWDEVIRRLQVNGVEMQVINQTTTYPGELYYIDSYSTYERAYEGHYMHYNTKVRTEASEVIAQPGDWYISLDQPTKRFIVEVLEPAAPDSYFNWNFFDPILMQKEWYSAYVFEDIAAELLETDPQLKAAFEARKSTDPAFAANPDEQLTYVYRNSVYYEKSHLQYPVARVTKYTQK
jgi:hypothetical protein